MFHLFQYTYVIREDIKVQNKYGAIDRQTMVAKKENFKWLQLTLLIIAIIGSIAGATWAISITIHSQLGPLAERMATQEAKSVVIESLFNSLIITLNTDRLTKADGARIENEIKELKRVQSEDPPDWFENNVRQELMDLKNDFDRLSKNFRSSFNLLGIKIQGFDRRLKDQKEDMEDYYIEHVRGMHGMQYKKEGKAKR